MKSKARTATFTEYEQRHSDGIHSTKQEWNLVWKDIDDAQYDVLWDFYMLHVDGDAFLWTPLRQTEELSFKVVSMTAPPEGWNRNSMTWSVKQVFDD